MSNITNQLKLLQDEKYANFQARLIPNIDKNTIIGIRVPILRKFAKNILKNRTETEHFLDQLPHTFYDENMLHSLILSEIKDYDESIAKIDTFLPFIDNWAVCDTLSPKVFKSHKPELLNKIKSWSASHHTYTCRFGLEMLMTHFLDENFDKNLLEIPVNIRSEEYYINMMIAWFFATTLAKQYESSLPYLKNHRLSPWVYNKTIQKARESYRLSPTQKSELNSLKIPKIP